MYVAGVRSSTLIVALLFLLAGLLPGVRWRGAVACLAWLVGFETAWTWTWLAVHHTSPDGWHWVPLALLVLGPAVVAGAWRLGVRPSDRLMVEVVVVAWLIWVATGFEANWSRGPQHVDPLAELLNEAAKIGWALAYLLPLLGPSADAAGWRLRRWVERRFPLPV